MNDRPVLDRNLDSKTFRDYYYLKEELVNFCRENGIPVSGGKIEIANRIAYFLETGKILPVSSESGWQALNGTAVFGSGGISRRRGVCGRFVSENWDMPEGRSAGNMEQGGVFYEK